MAETINSQETQKRARRKAQILYNSLANFAIRKDTDSDLERLDRAWDGVQSFPVQFNGEPYELQQDGVTVAALCGGIAVVGLTLVGQSETVVVSPSRLYESQSKFRILPPTLLHAGVQ